MAITLNVVERAYQGTLEEQDDQALWLVSALKSAGLEQAVLLRGPATAYAAREQSVGTLSIGGVEGGHAPRLDAELERLVEKGVAVYAVAEDAAERGIEPEDAVAGVTWIDRAGVAGLFREAGRIFAW